MEDSSNLPGRVARSPKDVRPDLDEVDRRILLALHADARMSNSALAEAVGIAASTCHGRVRRLQEIGVIRGFYTDIDPAAVGLSLQAMISVSLQSNARGKIRNFIAHIRTRPQVMDVYFLAGETISSCTWPRVTPMTCGHLWWRTSTPTPTLPARRPR